MKKNDFPGKEGENMGHAKTAVRSCHPWIFCFIVTRCYNVSRDFDQQTK